MFWIVLILGILAFIALLTAAGIAGFSKVMKVVKAKQEEALKRTENRVKPIVSKETRGLHEEPKARRVGKIVVDIEHDGSFKVENQILKDDELGQRFRDIFALNPRQEVTIRADEKTVAANVLRAIDLCSQAGLRNVSFTSRPPVPTAVKERF
jgi:hypothetical protein